MRVLVNSPPRAATNLRGGARQSRSTPHTPPDFQARFAPTFATTATATVCAATAFAATTIAATSADFAAPSAPSSLPSAPPSSRQSLAAAPLASADYGLSFAVAFPYPTRHAPHLAVKS